MDTWYADGASTPIAAEIYGANSHQGVALRSSKNSFFDVLSKVVNAQALSEEETLYFLAVCVRGGVPGGSNPHGCADSPPATPAWCWPRPRPFAVTSPCP